jgi:pimeloyl-ACP methyl ester carboxylesterase
MPHLDLPQGRLHLRDEGPADGPAVVFVHGYSVDGAIWDAVVAPLLAEGIRCIRPDLPLGSHTTPAGRDDLAPRDLALMVASLLEALDLDDVTLVGNDSGGALCQLLVDARPERIGRLVLTNCDTFERFPPPSFRPLLWLARAGLLHHVLRLGLRTGISRRLFDAFTVGGFPPGQADAWVRPYVDDPVIRRETDGVLARVDGRDLAEAGARLHRFDRPVLLAWGADDRLFPLREARRLSDAFGDNARLVELPGARTFPQIDAPERLAELLLAEVRSPVPA